MKMDKLAAEHADWVQKSDVGGDVIQKRGSLRIVNVEYGAARELCTELQIARLPTLHLYMPGAETTAKTNTATTMQRVQDFVCPPSEFHRLQDLTAFYLKKQKQQQTAVIDPTVTCSRGPVPTAMNLQSANDAFEAKLDAGRNLIREKLAAQLPAVAAKLYAAGAATKDEEDGKADNKPRTKSGFWNRFRKSKASNNTSDVA